MAQRIDHVAGLQDFAADLADQVAGVAGLGAGCILHVCALGVVAHLLDGIQQGLVVEYQFLLGIGQGIVLGQQLPNSLLVGGGQQVDGLQSLDLLDDLQNRLLVRIAGRSVDVQRGDGAGAGLGACEGS